MCAILTFPGKRLIYVYIFFAKANATFLFGKGLDLFQREFPSRVHFVVYKNCGYLTLT